MEIEVLISEESIKKFEFDQKEWSTEVALHNLYFELFSMLFKGIGVTGIKTKHKK